MKDVDRVNIYEDWEEDKEGIIWYKWKKVSDKKWHWVRTGYTQKPFIQMKSYSKREFDILTRKRNET